MTFAWPFVLSLLLIPLAALWVRRRARAADGDGALPGVRRGRVAKDGIHLSDTTGGPPTPGSRHPRLWLGLALVIFALARPQWGVIQVPSYTQSREILVAIDLSRSMLATDITPNRLERAKLLTRGLLDALKGERVGLIVFAGTAFLQCPLSADYEIMREFLPPLSPDFLPEGGSNYDALLETTLSSFGEGEADRFLIVLSDGEATDDFWRERLPELKRRGVRVLGLGVGTAAGSMIPQKEGGFVKDKLGAVVLSKLESGTLRALSEATQGTYRDASTWVDLPDLVRATVETGRTARSLESTRERREERFMWFLAPGLLLVLWSLWREFPRAPRATRAAVVGAAKASLIALALLPSSDSIAAEPTTVPPPPSTQSPAGPLPSSSAPTTGSEAAPLVALARDMASRADLPPREWARYAQATLDYARRRQGAGQEISTQALRDGLAAVAEGESMDAKAADWETLRKQLNQFLQPSPTPTPPPQPSPSPQPTPTPSATPSGNPSPPPQGGGTPPPGSGQPSPRPQNNSQDPSDPSQGRPDQKQDGRPQNGKDQNRKAFDGMNPTPPPPPGTATPPPSRQEKQKVGGQSVNRGAPTPSGSPQLTVAQQKLDQVREDDKPAELQELLRNSAPKADKPEKDW